MGVIWASPTTCGFVDYNNAFQDTTFPRMKKITQRENGKFRRICKFSFLFSRMTVLVNTTFIFMHNLFFTKLLLKIMGLAVREGTYRCCHLRGTLKFINIFRECFNPRYLSCSKEVQEKGKSLSLSKH